MYISDSQRKSEHLMFCASDLICELKKSLYKLVYEYDYLLLSE